MKTNSPAKKNTKFCELSSLVLVDILAALSMEHALRMARLGHERLRHICSLKWVKDRMTDVNFEEVFRVHKLKGDTAATFCASSVMKRLNGELKISRIKFDNTGHIDDYVEMAEKVTGRLHLCSEGVVLGSVEACNERTRFTSALGALPNLIYASHTVERGTFALFVIMKCPGLVFDYCYRVDERSHAVLYRPALLNGRHVVDVLRTVCGPADISEAELDRVRRKATEGAKNQAWLGEGLEGVWATSWLGDVITAKN